MYQNGGSERDSAAERMIANEIKILENRRMSDREIASVLEEKEFRIKKTRELTRYYSEKEIRNLIISLEDIDLKMKTTDIDSKNLLELFITNM